MHVLKVLAAHQLKIADLKHRNTESLDVKRQGGKKIHQAKTNQKKTVWLYKLQAQNNFEDRKLY